MANKILTREDMRDVFNQVFDERLPQIRLEINQSIDARMISLDQIKLAAAEVAVHKIKSHVKDVFLKMGINVERDEELKEVGELMHEGKRRVRESERTRSGIKDAVIRWTTTGLLATAGIAIWEWVKR
jgi:hypothetical protein